MPNDQKTQGGGKAGVAKDVETVRQQQHTGNHEGDAARDKPYGADEFGGTRAGAENVEAGRSGKR